MAASRKTVEQIYAVLVKHFPAEEDILPLVIDIEQNVRGNNSFRETIAALRRIAEERR